MKLGLIGTGTIGRFLLENINIKDIIPDCNITAVLDERPKARHELPRLAKTFHFTPFYSAEELLQSDVDLVIECANVKTAQQYAPIVLRNKNMLLISVGALVDVKLLDHLDNLTKTNQTKLYLPPGAIGGLDIIQAGKMLDGLNEVVLETRKPAHALLEEQVEYEKIVFSGNAKSAIEKFPKNANVAITLSLAGLGIDKTQVNIIADPQIDKNIHTIKGRGEFGEFMIRLKNNPSPTNPKTSHLTSLSILSTIHSLQKQIVIR